MLPRPTGNIGCERANVKIASYNQPPFMRVNNRTTRKISVGPAITAANKYRSFYAPHPPGFFHNSRSVSQEWVKKLAAIRRKANSFYIWMFISYVLQELHHFIRNGAQLFELSSAAAGIQ